jgi:hypothetical protein
MKKTVLFLATIWPCLATTPAPYGLQRAALDQIAEAANSKLLTSPIALEILQRIAEGRMQTAPPGLETRVALKPGELRVPAFQDPMLREIAVRKIGESGLPEAVAYLERLKEEDLGPNRTVMLWAAAQIALREAQMNRLPDDRAKIRFLEDTTSEWTAAASWAVDELCNRGSSASLGFIRVQIRRSYSLPQDYNQALGFCEARIRVVSRDPDRIRALGSFLDAKDPNTLSDNRAIIAWTIRQLKRMKSEAADAELERFSKEIDDLPDGAAARRDLVNAIRGYLDGPSLLPVGRRQR